MKCGRQPPLGNLVLYGDGIDHRCFSCRRYVVDGGSELALGIVGMLFGGLGGIGAILLLRTNMKGVMVVLLSFIVAVCG